MTTPPDDRPAPGAPRLAGERALVTGATSGIGRAVAIEFAAEGAAVVVHGRDPERGRAVVEEIVAVGGEATFVAADLLDPAACARLVEEAVVALGGLTVLVNNAAGAMVGDGVVGELTLDVWDTAMRANATAPMLLCRDAIPHMIAAGHGAVVNVSSRQAERPSAGHAAYAATKGALNALTRAIAVEYAGHGIRANTLSPGYVLNDRRDADLDDARRARLEAMHLTRLGTARDCALAAVYLASRESEYLTGINLQLDGGSSNARAASFG